MIFNRHVHLGSCNLYADDTLIYCTGSNIVDLKTNIQICVTDVHEWYESNQLVINTSKSNVMQLTTRQMLSHMTYTDLNVRIGNHAFLQCNNNIIVLVLSLIMCCRGTFKQTALVRNLFLSFLDCPG